MKIVIVGLGIAALLFGCFSVLRAERGKNAPDARESSFQTAVFAVS
jgi:hypothetical protein